MEQYEQETGRHAIWRNKITEGFKKWQKGEKDYYLNRDRLSLYVPEGVKEEWINFAEKNNYSSLSKLIRKAVESLIDQDVLFTEKTEDFLSNLSHDLKDPLTSLKAYLQLIIEEYGSSFEEGVRNILSNAFNQCINLEKIIVKKLDVIKSDNTSKLFLDLNECDIALIEDEVTVVNFLEIFFKKKGFSCVSATNGRDGLKLFSEYTPKLVLLDLILPDISGYDIIKSIRSNKTIQDIPVVFLTAIPRAEALENMKKFNVTDVISKPFDLKDFKVVFDLLKR